MKSILSTLLLLLSLGVEAGNHGPCKIQQLNQSDTYPKFMLIKMECQGTSLATSCNNILTDAITYDATTEVGKFRTSLILSAFMAGKDVQISTWGACPTEIDNVPLMYGLIIK